ncbi:conserved hypothetical protein [Uncinocarpus reesii 1704]|uniref:14-3-3 domain-containing protein n=1 Tax=Uncinocarpus reesii (strain UAMH 1704) TaxID=336963 RepID=C4JTT8_UNCRE|nr:uncharacterized protein UREG_05877 [Uncinocarpus reesii 1704]EEP81035.1 conserved hypothetical protein [Uncinocarpus reesii 1704]
MGSFSSETVVHLAQDPDHASELISLSYQWKDQAEPPAFALWMASSEVDQKFLGHFATATSHTNPFLSGMLYKLLGLSVVLSKKLLRARKSRRLDPTRETKSLQLYHHILWLSREGLIIVEQYILPMVADYIDLKVLSYKLQASFYHIFVLFHNQPRISRPGIQTFPFSTSHLDLPNGTRNGQKEVDINNRPISIVPSPPPDMGGPVGGGKHAQSRPPGLGMQPDSPKIAASFILPALDYTPRATACFSYVALLADQLLPGSHPIRLSVKLEYAAYLYDCLHDASACRRLAKQAIADVYKAQEGMDDESFEDAAELVGILGKMVKRGGKTSSAGGSSVDKSWSDGTHSTPTRTARSGDNTPKMRQKRIALGLEGSSPAIAHDPVMGHPI